VPRTTERGPRQIRRRLDGVLLFDKPAGLSSNGCLGVIKRLFAAQKAGHTGTLDPFATGLLPVGLGEATKFAQDLLEADKTYLATLRLGATTSTGDIEGEVTSSAEVRCDDDAIAAALARFRGPIEQVPPMYSALKRDGKPLYEYARAGIELERMPRPVVIHALDRVSRDSAALVLRVRCSKGTYIRTLAEDIGRALGCGAHLTALRREAVGPLSIEDAVGVPALEAMSPAEREACLRPADALAAGLPLLVLDATQATRLRLGQRVPLPVAAADAARVRAYDPTGVFLGLVRVGAGVAHPLRLTAPEPPPAFQAAP
jgi:tRNA pseudouridine55 synthase